MHDYYTSIYSKKDLSNIERVSQCRASLGNTSIIAHVCVGEHFVNISCISADTELGPVKRRGLGRTLSDNASEIGHRGCVVDEGEITLDCRIGRTIATKNNWGSESIGNERAVLLEDMRVSVEHQDTLAKAESTFGKPGDKHAVVGE
jgi:hypothetical protein